MKEMNKNIFNSLKGKEFKSIEELQRELKSVMKDNNVYNNVKAFRTRGRQLTIKTELDEIHVITVGNILGDSISISYIKQLERA